MHYIKQKRANYLLIFLFKLHVCSTLLISCKPIQPVDTSDIVQLSDNCDSSIKEGLLEQKIKGMSFVAPPDSFDASSMQNLSNLGANWIAALPFAYFNDDNPHIRTFSGGWWGERPEGICHTINLAHQNGLKVLLKPQLWNHQQWIGALDFKETQQWDQFHASYTQFIIEWAQIAEETGVEMFCIGTELRFSSTKFSNYWKGLIQKIRTIYSGKLIYASNWDNVDAIQFWDKLDYIGTDAYFSLTSSKTPSVCALKAAWQPTVIQLKKLVQQWERPIIFTEYGYMSVDGCAFESWELESKRSDLNVNELAQSNALQAILEVFAEEAWWKGGFLWKWYPNYAAAMGEGQRAKDYTPQGKLAEKTLRTMFH